METDRIERSLLKNIRQLSPNEQSQVLDFVESLNSKQDLDKISESTRDPKDLTLENQPLNLGDRMADIQKKPKDRTIAQAILEVMNTEKRALTSQEICQLILERNLYHFNTNDPLKMVRDAIWRHDMKTGKRSSPNKYFIQDGKYWIPYDDIDTPRQGKEETPIVDIDIEASFYDYLFELEDLDNNEL